MLVAGRIVGLNKYKVLLAITIGTLTGTMTIAYITVAAISILSFTVFMGIIFAFLGGIAAYRFYSYYKKRKTSK